MFNLGMNSKCVYVRDVLGWEMRKSQTTGMVGEKSIERGRGRTGCIRLEFKGGKENGEWTDELFGMPLLNSSMEGKGKEGSGKIEYGLVLNAKEEVREE